MPTPSTKARHGGRASDLGNLPAVPSTFTGGLIRVERGVAGVLRSGREGKRDGVHVRGVRQ